MSAKNSTKPRDWEKDYRELVLLSARLVEQWDQEAAEKLKAHLEGKS